MKTCMTTRSLVAGAAAFAVYAAMPSGSAAHENGQEQPFAEANLFFELNDTDGDLGIHALIDGDAWKRLEIEGPRERKMLDVRVTGRLRQQGLTEIFFESAEPSFDELAPADFFRRFPEGEYEIEGTTLEGDELESTDTLSHVMPAPPENITISGTAAVENCDVVPLPSVSGDDPVVISWDAVEDSHPEIGKSGSIEVVNYELIVERDDEDATRVFSINLPSSVTEGEVPAGFIALGEEFKFEIIVREASGNQTAVESCFVVE